MPGDEPPPPAGLPMATRPSFQASGDAEKDGVLRVANTRAMAWYLGMNLILDAQHMAIAEAALASPLPAGWVGAGKGGQTYYWEVGGGPAQWEHPADAEFRRQLLEARAAARTASGDDPVMDMAVPGVARPVAGEANVEEMAVYLGMDTTSDLPLIWIADAALTAELPKGWSSHSTAQGQSFFHNAQFGITQWEHPTDHFYRSLYLVQRAELDGEAPAADKLPRPMPKVVAEPVEADEKPPVAAPATIRHKTHSGSNYTVNAKVLMFGGKDAAKTLERLLEASPFAAIKPKRVVKLRPDRSVPPARLAPDGLPRTARTPACCFSNKPSALCLRRQVGLRQAVSRQGHLPCPGDRSHWPQADGRLRALRPLRLHPARPEGQAAAEPSHPAVCQPDVCRLELLIGRCKARAADRFGDG